MRARTPTPPTIRGWCPSVTAPLEALDGWVVRVRIGARPVGALQWETLATVAERDGSGVVELTSRANVQLRGLRTERLRIAAGQLIAAGLAASTEDVDRSRSVMLNPLLDHPWETPVLAERRRVQTGIERVVARHGRQLPPKWWAVVDAEVPWPAPCHSADLAVSHRGDRWVLWVAGEPRCHLIDPLPAVATLVQRCAQLRCRAAALPASVRSELTTSATDVPAQVTPPIAERRTAWWGPRQIGRVVVAGASPALGVTGAASLRVLARLARRPAVSIRPTTERGVVAVAPVHETGSLLDALDTLARHGWVIADDDPRRLLSACIGTRGCSAAFVDTHRLASRIRVAERTHVSGCPKRCGAPGAARELIATPDGIEERRR